MGYARQICYAGAFAAALGLAGCSQGVEKQETALDKRVADLEGEVKQLRQADATLQEHITGVGTDLQQLGEKHNLVVRDESARRTAAAAVNLIIGSETRGSYVSDDACQRAKTEVLRQAKEGCLPPAVYCSPPTAYCVPQN